MANNLEFGIDLGVSKSIANIIALENRLKDLEQTITEINRKGINVSGGGSKQKPLTNKPNNDELDLEKKKAELLKRRAEREKNAINVLRQASQEATLEYRRLELEQKKFIKTNGQAGLSSKQFAIELQKVSDKLKNVSDGVNSQFRNLPKQVDLLRKRVENQSLDLDVKSSPKSGGIKNFLATSFSRQVAGYGVAGDTLASSLIGMSGGATLALAGVATAVVGLGVALTEATQRALEFERGMVKVAKTTGLSEQSMLALESSLLGISSSTGFAKEGLVRIAENAGSQGIEGAENIAVYTEAIAKLASVSDLSADEASANVGRLLAVFQLDPSLASNIGSTLNDIADSYNATEAGIVQFASRVAPTTKQLGLSVDETIAFGGILVSAIGSWEIASSSLNTVLTNLVKEMPKVAEIAGITANEFEQLKASDPKQALELFFQGLNKLDKINRERAVVNIFGQGQDARTALILADAYGDVAGKSLDMREALNQAGNAFKSNVSLNTAMSRVLDSTSGKIDVFTARWDSFLTTLGKPIVGILGEILGGINSLFDTSEDKLNQFISKVGKTQKSVNENNSAIEGLKSVSGLVDEYDKLVTKKERTVEEDEKLLKITEQLAKQFPAFVTGYDEAGNAVGVFTDGIRKAIDAQTILLRLQNKDLFKEQIKEFETAKGKAEALRREIARIEQEARSAEARFAQDPSGQRTQIDSFVGGDGQFYDKITVITNKEEVDALNSRLLELQGELKTTEAVGNVLGETLRAVYGNDAEKAIQRMVVDLQLSRKEAEELYYQLLEIDRDFTANVTIKYDIQGSADEFLKDMFGFGGTNNSYRNSVLYQDPNAPKEQENSPNQDDKPKPPKEDNGSNSRRIQLDSEKRENQRLLYEQKREAEQAQREAQRIAEERQREEEARQKRILSNRQAFNKFLVDIVDESYEIELEASRRENPYLDKIDAEFDEYLKKKRELNRSLTEELYATIDAQGNGIDFKEGLGKADLATGQIRINQALSNYASLRDVDIAEVLRDQAKDIKEQIQDITDSFLDLDESMNNLRGLDEIPFFSEMKAQEGELKDLEKLLGEVNIAIAENERAIATTEDESRKLQYTKTLENFKAFQATITGNIDKVKQLREELIKLQIIENKRIALVNQEELATASINLLDAQGVGDTPERTAQINALKESIEDQLVLNVNKIIELETSSKSEKSQQRINELKKEQLALQLKLIGITKSDYAYAQKIYELAKLGKEITDNEVSDAISQLSTQIADERDPVKKEKLIKQRADLLKIQQRRQKDEERAALSPIERFADDFADYGSIVSNILGDIASAWESSIRRRQQAEDDLLQTLLANGQITQDEAERRAKQNEEIAKAEFARYKKLAIAQALVSGSVAVIEAFRGSGGIALKIAQAAAVAIATGIQIAQIKRQEYWKGGLVEGNGYPSGRDTVPASLTKKEFVTPVGATREHLPFLEAMREGKTKEELASMYLPYLSKGSFIPRNPSELEILHRGGTLNQQVNISTQALEAKVSALTATVEAQTKTIESLIKEQNTYIRDNKPKPIKGSDALNLMALAKDEQKKISPR